MIILMLASVRHLIGTYGQPPPMAYLKIYICIYFDQFLVDTYGNHICMIISILSSVPLLIGTYRQPPPLADLKINIFMFLLHQNWECHKICDINILKEITDSNDLSILLPFGTMSGIHEQAMELFRAYFGTGIVGQCQKRLLGVLDSRSF